MTIMRLNADLKTVSFSKSSYTSYYMEDKEGIKHNIPKITHIPLGKLSVCSDFNKLSYLSKEEAIQFREFVDQQLAEIANAFANNAKNGNFGGRPVIKSNSRDDAKYKNFPGYIPKRKVGEFIGVIADTYKLDIPNDLPDGPMVGDVSNIFSNIMDEPSKLQAVMKPLYIEVMNYAASKSCTPHYALAEEQIKALFLVSQQLHYLVHKGFKWPVTKLIEMVEDSRNKWIDEFKFSSKNASIWGSAKTIPVLLRRRTPIMVDK